MSRSLEEFGELNRPWWAQGLDYRLNSDDSDLYSGPTKGCDGPDLLSGCSSSSCSWILERGTRAPCDAGRARTLDGDMGTPPGAMSGLGPFDRSARRWMLALAMLLALACAMWSVFGAANRLDRAVLAQLAFFVALPTALVAALIGRRWSTTLALVIAIECAGALIAVPIGWGYDAWRARRTQAWCEEVAARIGTFAQAQGRLPFGFVELGGTPQPRWTFPVRYRALNRDYTLCFDHSGEDGRTSGYNSKRDLWWVDEAVHGDAWVESLGIFAEPLDPW